MLTFFDSLLHKGLSRTEFHTLGKLFIGEGDTWGKGIKLLVIAYFLTSCQIHEVLYYINYSQTYKNRLSKDILVFDVIRAGGHRLHMKAEYCVTTWGLMVHFRFCIVTVHFTKSQ